MHYRHLFDDGSPAKWAPGKVVCVGRNYAAHARELGNEVPENPVIFMKPATSMVALAEPVRLPPHAAEVHHEIELALLVGEFLQGAGEAEAVAAVAGYGVALDLTLRDVQQRLKDRGHPWEMAKAFDGSCPLSPFVRPADIRDPRQASLRLRVNGELRQDGNTADMVTPIAELLAFMSRYFTLLPGDVVLTGTPQGVAPLRPGDKLDLELDGRYRFSTAVAG